MIAWDFSFLSPTGDKQGHKDTKQDTTVTFFQTLLTNYITNNKQAKRSQRRKKV